jgi:hypothetical protein
MNIRPNNVKLYRQIQARFKELYNGQKMRYECCIETLAEEFYKAKGTIGHILRLDLPKEEQPPQSEKQGA